MKFSLPLSSLAITPHAFLRSAGYRVIYSRQTGQESFVRAFGRGHYPRFHIYITGESDHLIINLHLDQKQPSYSGTSAHSGEYDSPVVKAEVTRLKNLFKIASDAGQPNLTSGLKDSAPPSKDPRSQRWSNMLRRM